MNNELKKKFERMMYRFTKDAARSSFLEYLEWEGLSLEDWQEIKKELIKTHGISDKAFYI